MTSVRRKWTVEERREAVRPLLDGQDSPGPHICELAARAAEIGVSVRTLRRWLVTYEMQNAVPHGVLTVPESAPRAATVTPIDSVSLPQTITQDFLAELWSTKRKAAFEIRLYREMLDHAVNAIRAGAEVEPGLHDFHVAEICDKHGRKFVRAVVL